MLHARSKPGVVVHCDHIIVMGGATGPTAFADSIEVMNWKDSVQWSEVSLPMPLGNMKPMIYGDQLAILGYASVTDDGEMYQCNGSYQIPVDNIVTSVIKEQPSSTDQLINQWNTLTPLPHSYTATVPNSNPPMIIGGRDNDGIPSSDLAVYDWSHKSWRPYQC